MTIMIQRLSFVLSLALSLAQDAQLVPSDQQLQDTFGTGRLFTPLEDNSIPGDFSFTLPSNVNSNSDDTSFSSQFQDNPLNPSFTNAEFSNLAVPQWYQSSKGDDLDQRLLRPQPDPRGEFAPSTRSDLDFGLSRDSFVDQNSMISSGRSVPRQHSIGFLTENDPRPYATGFQTTNIYPDSRSPLSGFSDDVSHDLLNRNEPYFGSDSSLLDGELSSMQRRGIRLPSRALGIGRQSASRRSLGINPPPISFQRMQTGRPLIYSAPQASIGRLSQRTPGGLPLRRRSLTYPAPLTNMNRFTPIPSLHRAHRVSTYVPESSIPWQFMRSPQNPMNRPFMAPRSIVRFRRRTPVQLLRSNAARRNQISLRMAQNGGERSLLSRSSNPYEFRTLKLTSPHLSVGSNNILPVQTSQTLDRNFPFENKLGTRLQRSNLIQAGRGMQQKKLF